MASSPMSGDLYGTNYIGEHLPYCWFLPVIYSGIEEDTESLDTEVKEDTEVEEDEHLRELALPHETEEEKEN